ncbi:MAG: PilN domain-containing protein [Pseudomonadota bacterium]
MARINLLPWRDQVRQKQKNQYFSYLGGVALVTLAIAWIVGQFIDAQIRHQQSRNLFLTQQIEILDTQIQEIRDLQTKIEEITIRMSLIEQLQVSRNLTTTLLAELARAVPNGISLSSVTRKENDITILGVSESNNRLSAFMRAIDGSEVFSDPELSSIVSNLTSNIALSDFELSVKISSEFTIETDENGNPIPAGGNS